MLKEGMSAPAFTAPDQNGRLRSLGDYNSAWLLLYFYPKDDTPGCAKEACGLRDRFSAYREKGIAVLGVSPDDEQSHAAFAGKYDLPFPLLADPQRTIIEAYGVWRDKQFMGKNYMGVARTSFLINPDGVIAKIYEDVKPEEHPAEVLADFEKLR